MSSSQNSPPERSKPVHVRAVVTAINLVIPVLILVGAAALFRILLFTAPEAERAAPARQARLVEIAVAKPFDERIRVQATGIVMPAFDVVLSPQVSGEVVWKNPQLVPGGRFREGDEVLRLDPRDYELAVEQRESDVTQARAELTLEQGNQAVARHEYEVLGEELSEADRVLVFREPQLASARGALAAAEALLRDARLDLERTVIRAPFDALVQMESVEIGSILGPQSEIAALIGTDRFWIELAVPQSDLRWIAFPAEAQPGSAVELNHPGVWGTDASREGYVERLLPGLSDQGRMARILVAVDDPLALEPENRGLPNLLVGQYLEAYVEGTPIDSAVEIPRPQLRDGDNVWIMNEDDVLEIRPIQVAYRGRNYVYATDGVFPGERIVATDLATYAAGMPLRTESLDDAGREQARDEPEGISR